MKKQARKMNERSAKKQKDIQPKRKVQGGGYDRGTRKTTNAVDAF